MLELSQMLAYQATLLIGPHAHVAPQAPAMAHMFLEPQDLKTPTKESCIFNVISRSDLTGFMKV